MARHLASRGELPELVLCSSARRAVETLAPLRETLAGRARVRVEPELYAAGVERLLARLRRVPDSARRVMVVGHDPGLHELAVTLARGSRSRALAQLREKLPTGSLVVLAFSGPWRELTPASARLVEFTRPREL
jgi:phosphohistidine phosphatase